MAQLTLPQAMQNLVQQHPVALTIGQSIVHEVNQLIRTNPVLKNLLLVDGKLCSGLYLFINNEPYQWVEINKRMIELGDNIILVQPLSGG